MIPQDEARLTREFSDFYVILPSMPTGQPAGEWMYAGNSGKPVAENFEYSSETNHSWATPAQLLEMLQ
jgi:UDP-N-acetylglucosamine 4,6-dehydratase